MQTKWKIVPVEPTEKIRLAIKDTICKNAEQHELSDLQECGLIYKDAISAAPPCEDLETVREALVRMAHFDDIKAHNYLKETGSYSMFDEPASVAASIEALAALGRIRGEG